MPSAFGLPIKAIDRYVAPPVMTLLTTLKASTSASLSFTGFSSKSYKHYQLIINSLIPSVDASVQVYGSIDSGVSYASNWQRSQQFLTDAAAWSTSQGLSTAQLTVSQKVEAANYDSMQCSGVLNLFYSSTSGIRPLLLGYVGSMQPEYTQTTLSTGVFNNATELNTLKFQFDTGNILNGTIRIYGVS